MKKVQFFAGLCLITLFTACTTQVETDLPKPETTQIETNEDMEVTLRSTQAECDDLETNLNFPYVPSEIEAYFTCRLNQGVNEDSVETKCTFSEQVVDTACVDPADLKADWEPFVDNQKRYVRFNSDDCLGCSSGSLVWGCRVPIFTVTYLNDTECPGAPDEWQFRVVADVYCCL